MKQLTFLEDNEIRNDVKLILNKKTVRTSSRKLVLIVTNYKNNFKCIGAYYANMELIFV